MIKYWFDEAIRRRVFRTAGLYIVGAWVAIQVFDAVFEAWGLPDSAMRYLFLAAILGFPLALIFGWKFDVTSKGIVRTVDSNDESDQKLKPLDYLFLAVLLSVTVFVVYRVAGFTLDEAEISNTADSTVDVLPTQLVAPNSVAVMPFENMSNDEANAYFSDGVSEELLNSLTRVDGLDVTARTSAFALRDENLDIREIARRLSVANVIAGSVRKADNRVRITAQLIRAEDGFHLWSQTYDRDLDDIFAIQTEVAELIATALKPELGVDEISRMMAGSTSNVEALDQYLRGRSLSETRIATNIEASMVHYQHAISLDPEYALAFNAMAGAYLSLADYGGLSTVELFENGIEFAEKSIELSPELGIAYSTMALYRLHQGKTDDAYNLGKKAIEFDPSNPDILRIQARILRFELGRYAEAVELTRRAVELDPLAPMAHVNYATAMWQNGDPEAAIEEYKRALVLNPELPVAFNSMSFSFDSLGEVGKVAWAIKRSLDLNPESRQSRNMHAQMLLKFGLNTEAEHWARQTIDISPAFFGGYFTLFQSLLRQGKPDEARKVREQILALDDSLVVRLVTKLDIMIRENAIAEDYRDYIQTLDWQVMLQAAIESKDVETTLLLMILDDKAGTARTTGELLSMVEQMFQGMNAEDPDPMTAWELKVGFMALQGELESAIDYLESLEHIGSFQDQGLNFQYDFLFLPLAEHPRFISFSQRMANRIATFRRQYEANLETKLPDDWIEIEPIAQ